MALGKTSAFSKLEKKEEAPGTQSPYQGPGLGGDASRGGGLMRSLDEARGGIGQVEGVLNKGAKIMNQGGGFDTLGGGTGRSEDAYQSQRTSERNPTSLGSPTTGGFDSLWGSGQPLAPALPSFDLTAPDTTFSMPTGDQPISGAGLGGGLSSGDAGSFMGSAAGGVGAAGGLMSLAMDAKNGNWGNIAKDLIGLYGNASQLSNGTIPSISDLLGKGVDAVGSLFGGGAGGAAGAAGEIAGSGGAFAGELGGEIGGSLAGSAAAEGGALAAEGASTLASTTGSMLSSLIGDIAGPIAPVLPFIVNAITNTINGVDPWTGEPYRYAGFLNSMMKDQGFGMQNLGRAGQMFPYAQNQDELKYQIKTINDSLRNSQGTPVTGGGEWDLGYLPATGNRIHGKNIAGVDMGASAVKWNEVIQALKAGLPAGSGNPLTPQDDMRLAGQFLDRSSLAPKYSAGGWGGTYFPGVEGSTTEIPGFGTGFISPNNDQLAYAPSNTYSAYGDINYPYEDPGAQWAGANFPKPGEFFGSPSQAWQGLMKGQGFGSLGTNSNPGAPAGAGQVGGQKSNLQGTLGFAGLTGPLNEIRGGDNPNQV